MACKIRLDRVGIVQRFAAITLKLRLVAAVMLSAIFLTTGAGTAQAQAVDWVTNLDDIGSDPIPAGERFNTT